MRIVTITTPIGFLNFRVDTLEQASDVLRAMGESLIEQSETILLESDIHFKRKAPRISRYLDTKKEKELFRTPINKPQ